MVGSTFPRSVLPLVVDTAGASSNALAPRRRRRKRRRKGNNWIDRAVLRARSGLIAAHSVTTGDDNSNNPTVSLNLSARTASSPIPATLAPSVHPTTADATRAPASVPVLAITCGAVGGIIAVAVILALIYVRRIKRRVRSMKRRTNVLGPELAPMPMSPSQSSPLTIDSSRVTLDGMRAVPPRKASDLTGHLPPLSTSLVSSLTSIEHPSAPLSPLRSSTVIIGLPPAARRSVIPSRDPRSPIRPSHPTVPWPLVTSFPRSLSDPQRGHEERNTNSDTSESHTHT